MKVVGVIGLGYAGLPLAVAFAESGLEVIGVDVDGERVKKLNRRESYIPDVSDQALRANADRLWATTDYRHLQEADAAVICVPTPLSKTREPDISHILAAARELRKHVQVGMLVVLESTTYPGTTEEVLKPLLESSGLKVGQDIFLAFSPERIDPGNKRYTLRNTPKVVGGVTPACTQRAVALYSRVVEQVIVVSSATTAETVKLLENVFRAVNIGLVNEIAMLCRQMGVNVWEVVKAASTKPFGFMPFYPGPGIGGHCIPVDPLFLAWRAKKFKCATRFIELADEINRQMPEYTVRVIADSLNEAGKPVKGAKILLLGVAYKPDVADSRESPALDIMEMLMNRGAKVTYHDPYVSSIHCNGYLWESKELTESMLREADCTVILTNHSTYDWRFVVEHARLVIDTRNATAEIDSPKIIRL